MSVHAETSAVLRWLFAESGGEDVRATLLGAVFAQALSTWAVLELTDEVARRAEEGFPSEPARTLDAIHLASALVLRQSFPDLVIVTADERVRLRIARHSRQPFPAGRAARVEAQKIG